MASSRKINPSDLAILSARLSRGIVFLAVSWLIFTIPLSAAAANDSAIPWVSLLNGRDLSGWKIIGQNDPASAKVEDGMMVLRQRPNTVEHTFVASEASYGDFILELDLKDDPNVNSGILLRCVKSAPEAKIRLNGYQVKIDDTARAWTGGIFNDFGDSWTWMQDLSSNDAGRSAFKLGEWAHFRIECIGTTIKVWVNGIPTCHLTDEKYTYGPIALKIHSAGKNPKVAESAIRFKNIRIITENPKSFLKPMDLPQLPAATGPGKFDKAKPGFNP